MKITLPWQHSLLRAGLLSIFLYLTPSGIMGQCQCGSIDDVDPSGYIHSEYIIRDINGFMTGYNYAFQFPCLGNPLPLGGHYVYRVIIREKGTTEWHVLGDYAGTISDEPPFGPDLFLEAGPLDFCKYYEVRVTCPECTLHLGPFGISCTPDDQLEAYLNDPNNTLHNVSRIFEVCYSPITGQLINNLKITSVNSATNTATINWDLIPLSINYEVSIRKKPSSTWINLGTTAQNTFDLTDLDPCADYEVKVQGYSDNCCGFTKHSVPGVLSFTMTDCMSTIKKVDLITGTTAHLTWVPVGVNQTPQDYLVQWYKSSSNIMSATVSGTEYTLTNLDPNSTYRVKVTANCGSATCSSVSQIVKFNTNCEIFEPNNTFQTATPVAFDTDISNANILPAGDVDYFKFTPTTCQIEVKVDHPDIADYFLLGTIYLENDLPYKLYDQNFQEVPQNGSYTDAQGRPHTHLHFVKPGHDYYLAISGTNNNWTNLNCYTFKAMPCTGCDVVTNHTIFGEDKIYSIPSTVNYSLTNYAFDVQWSVSGPAVLNLQPEQYSCQLEFYDVGTVTLTATVTTCDGTVATFQKEIVVTNECYIGGTYTNAFNGGGLVEGFNLVKKLNYTISLDIPAGVGFNVYLNSGSATWVTNGNNIVVNQVTSVATIRIVLTGGNCAGLTGVYTFIKWPNGGSGDGPVAWHINPNPTSSILQITPTISNEVDPGTVPEQVDIRLFNQNAHLEIYQQGSTRDANQINLSNLLPGNYSLQLLYGEYWQQFNVVKQ